ncbi:hypothetical protein DUNSADRAFT_16968, partial [Dunaliella salina]
EGTEGFLSQGGESGQLSAMCPWTLLRGHSESLSFFCLALSCKKSPTIWVPAKKTGPQYMVLCLVGAH